MRAALVILGIVLGAAGGVIAYRAAFLAPPAGIVVVTQSSAHEVQNVWQIAGGIVLLVAGALIAFFAARRA